MRRGALVRLAVLLFATSPLAARPVVLLLTAQPDQRAALDRLRATFVADGEVQPADARLVSTAAGLLALSTTDLPAVHGADILTVVVAGITRRGADGRPVLAAEPKPVPLEPLLAVLAKLPSQATNLITSLTPAKGETRVDPAALWPHTDRPVAVLEGRHERFLAEVNAALTALAADVDGDGLVEAGELADAVGGQLGSQALALTARPATARVVAVAGLGGPDRLPPLVLVLSPRLRDDAPVLLDRAGPLTVQGLVADDRRVRDVTVNGRPAALSPANDPALQELGFPGRTMRFEATIPVAEVGFTEVEVVAHDASGNEGKEQFLVLTAAGAGPQPGSPVVASPDRVDAVQFTWGQTEDWRYGFRIEVTTTLHGLKGHACDAVVRFRAAGGAWLKDLNGQYVDAAGLAAATATFTPQYDHAKVSGIHIFVPQRELHLLPGQAHKLEAVVSIVDTTLPNKPVVATSDPQPFELTEPAQAATVYGFRLEHNAVQSGIRGLRLHVRHNVSGLNDSPCQLAVYFQRADGRPLPDRNHKYRSGDGSVAVFHDFTPPYDSSDYADEVMFIPYDELDLVQPGRYALRARAVVWDLSAKRALDASAWAYLTVDHK